MTTVPDPREDRTPEPLKAYTRYICPADSGGLGHSSTWTGAYLNPRPGDGRCICGEQFVPEVDDGTRWRLTWEMDIGQGWHPVEKETSSERDARSQFAGLTELAARGEPIRDIRLERAVVTWETVALHLPPEAP